MKEEPYYKRKGSSFFYPFLVVHNIIFDLEM